MPFEKGNNANPVGRPKGARSLITAECVEKARENLLKLLNSPDLKIMAQATFHVLARTDAPLKGMTSQHDADLVLAKTKEIENFGPRLEELERIAAGGAPRIINQAVAEQRAAVPGQGVVTPDVYKRPWE